MNGTAQTQAKQPPTNQIDISGFAPKDREQIRMVVDLFAYDQENNAGISTLIKNTLLDFEGNLIDKAGVDRFIYHMYYKTLYPDTYAAMEN